MRLLQILVTATSAIAIAAGLSAQPAAAQSVERRDYHERHMGVDVHLTLYGGQEEVANHAARTAYARVAELNGIFSDYDSDSEAMRLCHENPAGAARPVSADLFTVLEDARSLSRRSQGAFDVTIGPVSKLWRRSRRKQELPAAELLAAARHRVDWRLVQLDEQSRTVTLQRDDLQLDFGGIVKGYAAEAARQILKTAGFPQAMVALEGDISVGDAPPGTDGWKIGIAPLEHPAGRPSRWLLLKNASVSTSGDAFQYVEIDGVRYSHIVDPRTGLGLTQRSSVTVIAAHGDMADGLATTASILGPKAGLKFIAETPAEGLFVIATPDGIVTQETTGFARYLAP